MATHPGDFLLFSGPEQGCCPPNGPAQLPPVFSMSASQTSRPKMGGVGRGEGGGREQPLMYIHF